MLSPFNVSFGHQGSLSSFFNHLENKFGILLLNNAKSILACFAITLEI
jgi:hypothetical protein